MRGGNHNPKGCNQFSNGRKKVKRCKDSQCDVMWENGEPTWRNSKRKDCPAVICPACKSWLDEMEDE